MEVASISLWPHIYVRYNHLGNAFSLHTKSAIHHPEHITMSAPIRLFYSYSHKDETLRDKLEEPSRPSSSDGTRLRLA